ncbi:MAG: DUF4012 domain-containing protein [Patescibacteria group bacterium]
MSAKSNQKLPPSDLDDYLRKTKIPSDNVIDLKKLLVEQETKAKERSMPKSAKIYKRLEKTWGKSPFSILEIKWRNILVFGLFCLIIILPFMAAMGFSRINTVKGQVLGASVTALEDLKSAGLAMTNFDIPSAKQGFIQAQNDFTAAETELKKINSLVLALVKLVPFKGQTLTSGQHLISAGKELAGIGQIISERVEPLADSALAVKEDEYVLPQFLFSLNESFDTIEKKIDNISRHLAKVKVESLPEQYRPEMEKIRQILPALADYFQYAKKLFGVTSSLLGQEKSREYMFIFQNNQEIRATGGFIGSVALVKVDRGKIKILEVPGKGSYEINEDSTLDIIPPKPLWLVNNKWQIQDANWFPDFPATAAKINWFYEAARGFKVDGIISFTPDIIVELLKITGPITLDKYQTVITSENFITETQEKVEKEYDKEVNRPKALIGDLMPILITKIAQTKSGEFLDLLNVFQKGFTEKDILIYSADEGTESSLKDLGLAGEIKNAAKDFLMVVNTNVGGGKTDGVIDQEINHAVVVQSDGTIIDTVKIKRTHRGDPQDAYTKIKNIDYLRVYVPAGAELLEATGFSKIDTNLFILPDDKAAEDKDLLAYEKDPVINERSGTRITSEFGKTCFANWFNLEAGESREVTLKYKLPFKLTAEEEAYSLYLQKQAGAKESGIEAVFEIPADYQVRAKAPQGLAEENNLLKYQATLDKDREYGVILERK